MKVFYSEKPEEMKFCKLRDGSADVWIRENIKEVDLEDGSQWEADEVYVRTFATLHEIEAAKERIFSDQTAEVASVSDRLEAIEEAIEAIAEVIYG